MKKASRPANKNGTKRLRRGNDTEPAAHLIIGNRLRHYYKVIVQEPIPERFSNLLKELDGKLARPKGQ